MKISHQKIVRDLSWLAFNARVLQEAGDHSVHLHERLRFLGIFSNNLDEFFRVRVATLTKMVRLGKKAKVHLEDDPAEILVQIQQTVIEQQTEFDRIYANIIAEMEKQRIFIKTEEQLTPAQAEFTATFFAEKVRTQIVPLMIESIPQMPLLRDKSIYLACVLGHTEHNSLQRYALIEVPTRILDRFVILPSQNGEKDIILLEDIIRLSLPSLFAPFGFNRFLSYIIKVTRDAELEIENEINITQIEALEKSLKKRRHGRATRFVYDRDIEAGLLDYLTKRLNMSKKDNLIPGGRIHNFKDFMNFPSRVFENVVRRKRPFVHPLLAQPCRIMKVMEERDVMLHFPYHSFDSIIDLLREAAIDPFVQSIKITCYRLAKDSKVINALINAVRNGKSVLVMMELRARFDEEANLGWKTRLEEEGVKVIVGIPDMKVHGKLCVIRKREFNKLQHYGFISTGNFNDSTAQYYGDDCLLTTNKNILADVTRIFNLLEHENPNLANMSAMPTLPVAPYNMRGYFLDLIHKEIRAAKKKKPSGITLKMNSLVDPILIDALYEAAAAGVPVKLIIRGICSVITSQKAFKQPIKAISIIDEYLEHSRVFVFQNGDKPKLYISSADWMVRNLDHRVEAACPVYDEEIKAELMDMLNIQLRGNVKGRILDNEQTNLYVQRQPGEEIVRSQVAIYEYLAAKKYD